MSEQRALALFMLGLLLVEGLMLAGLSILDAGSDEVIFAYFMLMAAGAYLCSLIIMRYHR